MMRLFAVHDEVGNIHQVVTYPSDGPTLILTPAQGLFYTECDPPESLAEDADDAALLEFMKTHRLEISSPRAKAVRRADENPTSGQG